MITIKEVASLLKELKSDIEDDFRAYDEADLPSMQVTIATNDGSTWTYQTGDTSFTGNAYGFRHWSTVDLFRRSNCRELARDVILELRDLIAEENSY